MLSFGHEGGYCLSMRRPMCYWLLLVCCLAAVPAVTAATGRVIKVLPQYLDHEGRTALSPSLYERDAYQATLRQEPAKRSGIRYNIQWKTRGKEAGPLVIRVELRGVAEGNLPRQLTLEQPVKAGGWFSHWTSVVLDKAGYKSFGEVTAWRVTLWEGTQLLGEQKSFLW